MDNLLVIEIDELCTSLGIGKNTAYNLLNNGEIDAFKIGSVWKIPKESLYEYIDRKCNARKEEMVKIVK